MMIHQRQLRAFVSLDATLAVALLAVLATGLLLSIGYAKRGSGELAAHRTAMSRAESVLLAMQDSGRVTAEADVSVKELPTPAPQGFKWVQVRVNYRGKSAQLTGLVALNAGARL